MKRIGIDVGGTFTDVVLIDDESGDVWSAKVPTTPAEPVRGTLNGIARILELSGAERSSVGRIGHGTTIATNLIVEGKGARTALLTTKGFKDILEIRRVSRHDRADLYDLFFDSPAPLVPRRLRREVAERIRFDGSVLHPLSDEEVEAVVDSIATEDIEAVAVCLIHGYINADHEDRLVQALSKKAPHLFVSASSRVNPEMYEYERTSTTVMNAMIGPRCKHYVESFKSEVEASGVTGEVLFMQSNGGLAAPALVAERPVTLLQSGPAGGVTAAAKLCERLGIANAITGDMGGTSFDVSLIRETHPQVRTNTMLNSFTVRTPTIDIESIGAGGGSIAWIDEGGGVHIGPESAAADPGPACYGRGGQRPTVTDCNLILGYLDPQSFMGSEFPLDTDAAYRAVEKHLALPLGISVIEAARVVRSVANALMAQAMRLLTVERGFDPRDFAYICFGGAGPVHAIDLAAELDIDHVVVPNLPGLLSAYGMLIADQAYDFQTPVTVNLDELSETQLHKTLANLEQQATASLAKAGLDASHVALRYSADCRYAGQAETLAVEITNQDDVHPDMLASGFEAEHRRHWHFIQEGTPVTLVNVRLQITVPNLLRVPTMPGGRPGKPIPSRQRTVVLGDKKVEIPAYRRDELPVGCLVAGPAVMEEKSSSLVFPEGWNAEMDSEGNVHVKRER
ncbi:hydantoinase/oxoprolinase family protein [Pusillimonas caeni]|uniref:hydantoinase/oxoprolinase family protein n=1 Tax=Pusillimonas caeni TaxID=1348472 RepID=UPI000E599A15|nr:hydantoinase/oxoprolinase family protein [Pusillimonas caeni]TFL10215.1 hydantoinase/oxoprolinase family protein [Pusillimonas caeni]